MEDFSLWLKNKLAEKNMKPITLADRAELSHSAVSKYLNGTREPTYGALSRMADVLDVGLLCEMDLDSNMIDYKVSELMKVLDEYDVPQEARSKIMIRVVRIFPFVKWVTDNPPK